MQDRVGVLRGLGQHAELRDAVTILDGRAAALADAGQRVWDPSPDAPELVVLVDEFAELASQAPQANRYADSIARRGRAEAVNLIIATQRPSRDAMGKGAVRSQLDVRICLRVRERRDVDLILGQGMLAAGWHAEKLDAPGKFLISSPGHDTPRRARAYLLDDDMVGAAVRRHAGHRPPLDPASANALDTAAGRGTENAHDAHDGPRPVRPANGRTAGRSRDIDPETALWDALLAAPAEGAPVADLMEATGMGRSWIYYRLQEQAGAGRAVQTVRGHWRAVPPTGDHP
ncbi:MAG TPA: FtsK/SpoIIIE domain-containing protein [Streptosporangiaceae bacterium]|nr:FtsK/SpoIIIE domain-containing protein [Streptosporangiaceae bacterium]